MIHSLVIYGFFSSFFSKISCFQFFCFLLVSSLSNNYGVENWKSKTEIFEKEIVCTLSQPTFRFCNVFFFFFEGLGRTINSENEPQWSYSIDSKSGMFANKKIIKQIMSGVTVKGNSRTTKGPFINDVTP